jgi:hypothetical protein
MTYQLTACSRPGCAKQHGVRHVPGLRPRRDDSTAGLGAGARGDDRVETGAPVQLLGSRGPTPPLEPT